jgi:hypothetical protein
MAEAVFAGKADALNRWGSNYDLWHPCNPIHLKAEMSALGKKAPRVQK